MTDCVGLPLCLIGQLFSYSLFTWVLWLALAYLAARYLSWPGMIIGHLVTAGIVMLLDLQWIQAEMSAPGWDGTPDMDFVFSLGVLVRILMVNAVLLPIGFLGLRSRKKSKQRRFETEPVTDKPGELADG